MNRNRQWGSSENQDYRDPLIGILDYIAEQCPDQELVIAHEDDLQRIQGADVLTADTVESFLRQNKSLVQVKKGVAFLADEDEEEVPEGEKTSFRARADVDGEQLSLIIHPVLMKPLLRIDIASSPQILTSGSQPKGFSPPRFIPLSIYWSLKTSEASHKTSKSMRQIRGRRSGLPSRTF
ncbi:hypothetical protein H4582DRAFT_1950585 [Lactarius indigo]|nr:hypothetical protein H4582DRAFT_1950585 [Lactarius indigo]